MRAAAVNQYGTGGGGVMHGGTEGEVHFVDIPFMMDGCGGYDQRELDKIEKKRKIRGEIFDLDVKRFREKKALFREHLAVDGLIFIRRTGVGHMRGPMIGGEGHVCGQGKRGRPFVEV
jgi:hypothetical protein